jgi:ABC-type amino acid transport substrate-binding protein
LSIWRVGVFLFQLLPALILTVQAAEPEKVIRVGLPDDFPPYYYQDSNGDYKGASFEIAKHLLDQLGYRIEVTHFPSMRLMLAELKTGDQDLNINLTATEERKKVAVFTSEPHVFESQNLIVRSDSNIHFNGNLKLLSNYMFGPIFGWTYGSEFDNARYLKKQYLNNSNQQLKGLLSGRYDIALNNPEYVSFLSTELGITKAFKVLQPALFELPVTMAVSRKYPEAETLIAKLNQALIQFKKQPAYQEILQKNGFEVNSENREDSP